MKTQIISVICLLASLCGTQHLFAQAEFDDEPTEVNDGGLDADNWRMRYFGIGLVGGKPISVGLRLQGQIDKIGFGVEGTQTNYNVSRKEQIKPITIRTFGLFRLTPNYDELFKVHAMAGFTSYFNSDFGNFYVTDVGAEFQIHLERLTISSDVGYMFPVTENENYKLANLNGLLIGLSFMFWPF